jgi:hypothetical protein
VSENKIPTLATILPGYQDEFEDTTRDIKISNILGITEEDFEFIVKVAEMFFITERSLSSCIKRTLELIQERKNMNSYNHSLAVLAICMQVRERHTMTAIVQEKGLASLGAFQSAIILQSLAMSHEFGLGDYFTERLSERILMKHEGKLKKKLSAEEEAERAIKKLLADDDEQ